MIDTIHVLQADNVDVDFLLLILFLDLIVCFYWAAHENLEPAIFVVHVTYRSANQPPIPFN